MFLSKRTRRNLIIALVLFVVFGFPGGFLVDALTGVTIFSKNMDTEEISILPLELEWIAVRNMMFAAFLCVMLNIAAFAVGYYYLGKTHVDTFMDRFSTGATIALLLCGIDLAGFSIEWLNLDLACPPLNFTLFKGWKLFSLLPILTLGIWLIKGYYEGKKKLRQEGATQATTTRGAIFGFSPKSKVKALIYFMYLFIFQSLLPTAIGLTSFLVAAGKILDTGYIMTVAFLYLWGPASLIYSFYLVREDGWGYFLIALNLSTLSITFTGIKAGIWSVVQGVVPDFRAHLLVASALVIWVAYFTAIEKYLDLPEKKIRNYVKEKLPLGAEDLKKIFVEFRRDIIYQLIFLLVAPVIAIFIPLLGLRYSDSLPGFLFGMTVLLSLLVLFYSLPKAWTRFLKKIKIIS